MHCSLFQVFVCLIAIAGWFISFVGLLMARTISQTISWYIIGFELFLVSFSCAVLWTNTSKTYYPVVLTFTAVSISYSINEIAINVATRTPALIAVASGYFILIVTQIIWIFQFGVQRQEYDHDMDEYSHVYINNSYRKEPSSITFGNSMPSYPLPMHVQERVAPMPVYRTNESQNTVYLSPHADYTIPVKAIHSYEANKSDPNELSFQKGEVMYVHEMKGSWWQAKKSNGDIGMIPSNYVSFTAVD